MKKSCSWLPEAVAIVGVALGVAIAIRGWPSWPDAEGQTWAAWVQAIGSMIGIGIAIWVPWAQHRRSTLQAKQDDQEQIKRTLTAIRDEILVRYEQYCRIVKKELHEARSTGYMAGYWLFAADSFPVYRSSLRSLGGIESEMLRKGIVRSYALLEGLLLTIETNSRVAKRYLEELALHEIEPSASSAKRVAKLLEELQEYFPKILLAEKSAEDALRELMPLFPGERAVLYCETENAEELEAGVVSNPR